MWDLSHSTALAVMMLVVNLERLTINEIGGDKIPLLGQVHLGKYFSLQWHLSLPAHFGGTWLYIWYCSAARPAHGRSALMIITLWLLETKKGWMISGIPGVFMIITTIAV